MKKTILMDKYPVFSLEIAKSETTFTTVSEIMTYLKDKIDNHPIAIFIALFNHYEHTANLKDGVINPDIKDAQNLIFCFGKQLPNTKILAARPRSFGVCELQDSFVIDFLEAPNEQLHKVMEDWAKSVANK
ncbi:hypothetical protein MNB_SM-6-351 [hydrothermal vent metagenome]|uniref:Uncharacterized protein n=1 Tax=hydrothermal vent metagenome TaxID=652676 RepID=A0A1W1BHB1_9ZZZZ